MDLNLSDKLIKLTKYSEEDVLYSRFSLENWQYIISDIKSDKEWSNLLKKNSIIRCYVLKKSYNNEPIGFIYSKQEDFRGNVISLHGGGWDKSVCSSLYYYRGLILIIKELIYQNIKVRTSCFENNYRAYKFLRSVGFVKHSTSNGKIYMWINKRRLQSSKIYKRFFGADF